jgi:hypothetical protein
MDGLAYEQVAVGQRPQFQPLQVGREEIKDGKVLIAPGVNGVKCRKEKQRWHVWRKEV